MNNFRSLQAIIFCVVVSSGAVLTFGSEQKPSVPDSWTFEITDFQDTDQIKAKTVEGERKVKLVMANTLPFSAWPKELSKEEKKLKEQGIESLKARLLGKKVSVRGYEKNNVLHGDFILYGSGYWKPGFPSSLGWGIVHLNCMTIEEGYSLYRKDNPEWFFEQPNLGEMKQGRETLYKQAQAFAIKHKLGIWKHRELVERLKSSVATPETKK